MAELLNLKRFTNAMNEGSWVSVAVPERNSGFSRNASHEAAGIGTAAPLMSANGAEV
ncbi:hypothetical protein [Novosphingobium sp. 9]|uniref:hypothetical protein n=1 Tax=Novosphingobium sp. 9 TaxID=2025349 RepID=UPI0021B6799F|nr:hypothetical protein [Novosphingobium sp. 9]